VADELPADVASLEAAEDAAAELLAADDCGALVAAELAADDPWLDAAELDESRLSSDEDEEEDSDEVKRAITV
jgi:hypothetical protein